MQDIFPSILPQKHWVTILITKHNTRKAIIEVELIKLKLDHWKLEKSKDSMQSAADNTVKSPRQMMVPLVRIRLKESLQVVFQLPIDFTVPFFHGSKKSETH